jgi:hypothetical protein
MTGGENPVPRKTFCPVGCFGVIEYPELTNRKPFSEQHRHSLRDPK